MKWPSVRLGALIAHVPRPIDVKPAEVYREIGIRSHGHGIFHKNPVIGIELGDKKVYKIEPGDFVLNIVFAWEGAVAIAGSQERGMIGSHRFPTFVATSDLIDLRYLLYYFHTKPGLEVLLRVSPGGAGRNRTLGKENFLAQEIPLPPLSEQQRVVARLQAIIGKLCDISELANSSDREASLMVESAIHAKWEQEDDWPKYSFGEVVRLVSGQVNPLDPEHAKLPHISGESIESGTGRLLSYRTVKQDQVISGKYYFRAGSVLYSKIRPYLKKAVCPSFDGLCSADIYATDWISPAIEPSFLVYSLLSPRFTNFAVQLSGRTRMPKLNQDQLFSFKISIPDMSIQQTIIQDINKIAIMATKINEAMLNRTQNAKELLPTVLSAAFRGEL